MSIVKKLISIATIVMLDFSVTACTPEVGSDAWCEMMKEKPTGDWTATEAGDYAKHCIL
jgi:hypothetical protein